VRNILIQGVDSLLGSYFAARCLQSPDDQVFCVADEADASSGEDITELVATAAHQTTEGSAVVRSRQEIADKLHLVGRDLDVNALGRVPTIDEVWYFANFRVNGKRVNENQVETLETLISACPRIDAREFNYVEFDNATTRQISDHEISQRCKAQNVGYRIFRTSFIVGVGAVGQGHRRLGQSSDAFPQFLALLHEFKAEIEGRSPQYFDFQALRCCAPRDAALNLITARLASDLLLRIARAEGTLGCSFPVVSPQNASFSDLCERIGIAYGLGLLSVEDFGSLNAIDRAFHERLGSLHGYLMSGAPESHATEAYRAACLPLESVRFDEEGQIALFESLRKNADDARAARAKRFAGLPGRLASKEITRAGSTLSYYVSGSADTTVVILNALGQGLEYWYRLMDYLVESYRVIIWAARGTASPQPPFGITDQVDDLEAILYHENIEACHLVGWCTGPKVAIEFYLRHPSAVRSMAFLNGTFKCGGSPEEFDSPYEQNLESLCRMLVRKPAMAASVRKTFQSPVEESETELLEGPDSEQMSVSVLSLINADLKSYVLAPFRTEETTVNYAHQLVDFWAHDSRPKAAEVQIPVLLVGAEYDQVATPAASQMAAGLFPKARHVHVSGATHYCLYERPEFVAGLLKGFFDNSADLPVAQPVQDEVAQAR
jgi:pimeloyl-ACP methyl ester carboxylesterase